MPVLAQLQPLSEDSNERRRAPRLLLKLGAKVDSGSHAVVHDISTRGLLFETATALRGDRIHVHLPEMPAARARIVWSHGRFYGCEFEQPIPNASVSAALLRSQPRPAGNDPVQAEPAEVGLSRQKSIAAVVTALLLGGAAWLIHTGHLVGVLTAALAGLVAIGLLGAIMLWALDNSPNLKL